MPATPQTDQAPSRLNRWLGMKAWLIGLSLAGLLATNVATLLSASVHDTLYNGLRRVLLIGGDLLADRALGRSLTRQQDAKLRAATQTLADENRQLAAKGQRLQAAQDDLARRHAQATTDLDLLRTQQRRTAESLGTLQRAQAAQSTRAKAIAASVNRRLAKGVARNTAAIPAESVPYVGIGVTLSVTALDIHDACQTMAEINDLLKLLNQGEERADFCATRLPTVAQVVQRLKTDWRSSMERVAADARAVPAAMAVPDIRLPTAGETRAVVCPILGGPAWLQC